MQENELHFEKAPIVEALISIDVGAALSDEALLRLDEAAKVFAPDYPQSEPVRQFQFQFGVDVSTSTPQRLANAEALFGRKYVSRDKRQLVVYRRNGFSFSRLPPYQRWGNFRDEARRLWKIYRSATGELPIVRFGLRYINRVYVPLGRPASEYLRLYPEIPGNPDGSPRVINSSYMRVDSTLIELPGQLIIQQATLPSERDGLAALSLDFDISVFTPEGTEDAYVWDRLEAARHVKNQLFVLSLTEKSLEEFK